MDNVINDWLKGYLIGPMEEVVEGDGGRGWRRGIREEFEKRVDSNNNSVYIFDPTLEEQNKTGMESEDLHKKIKGWLASGNNDLVAEHGSLVWKGKTYLEKTEEGQAKLIHIMGDVDYVKNSNFLIARMEPGDKPCIAKNTKVLMADWTQKNIQDIKVGNKILGFKKLKGKTIMVKTEVYCSQKTGNKKCVKIEDDKANKIYATPDHKFLTRNKKHGSIYTEVGSINNAFSIRQQIITRTFLKGWLTGYLQNDGCFTESWRSHQVIIATNKFNEITIVKKLLKHFNFHSTITHRISKENGNKIYLLNVCRKKDYFELKDWKDNQPPSFDFKRGWIAGAIDADGYYDNWTIKYTQSKVHIKNRKIFKKYCKDLNIKYSVQFRKRKMKIFNRKINNSGEYTFAIAKSYAFFIPTQLPYKRKNYKLYLQGLSSKITITNSSKKEVYDLTTGTGNFIANGFIVHNCGTFMECGIALEHNIPIYVIQTMARTNYSASFVMAVLTGGGDFFDNPTQLFEFLDNKYNLKLK